MVDASPPLYEMAAAAQSRTHWGCSTLPAGESTTVVGIEGEGVVTRLWCSFIPETPERDNALAGALMLNLYWDGAAPPAVSAPLADFFCQPICLQPICNHFFSASSHFCVFNSMLPMPFREGARIEIVNPTDDDMLFWIGADVEHRPLSETALYLHTHWRRQRNVKATDGMQVLPEVRGRGRYLGTHWAVHQRNVQPGWPWYTRPVRVVADGESDGAPAISVGTLDDFVLSAWWCKETDHAPYAHPYTGRPYVHTDENGDLSVAFYRYHVPDPIWFHQNLSMDVGPGDPVADEADWSSTAFVYLDRPVWQPGKAE